MQKKMQKQVSDQSCDSEVLDANRDFGVQLATSPELRGAVGDGSLWLTFADEGEARLARDAWSLRARLNIDFHIEIQ